MSAGLCDGGNRSSKEKDGTHERISRLLLLLCLFYSSVVGDYGLHSANRRPKKRYSADRSAESEDRHDDDSGSTGAGSTGGTGSTCGAVQSA
jgi:hypothetical protein